MTRRGGNVPVATEAHSALSEQDISNRATELVGTLSAEEACSIGFAVGGLLKDGMPIKRALSSTLTVAEFVRRRQAAQRAVDAILSAERSKRKA